MPHGAALTEAEQLEITAAETGQLPPEGFSSQVVREHFLLQRGVVLTPIGFLREQEQISLESVRRTEEELPFLISEETLLRDVVDLPGVFRPGGAFFDVGPRAVSALGFDPGGEQLQAFDIFTPAHVAFGVVLALSKVPRPFAYAAIIATEIVEIVLRRNRIFPGFFTESPENVAVDVLASAAGFEIGRLLPTAR